MAAGAATAPVTVGTYRTTSLASGSVRSPHLGASQGSWSLDSRARRLQGRRLVGVPCRDTSSLAVLVRSFPFCTDWPYTRCTVPTGGNPRVDGRTGRPPDGCTVPDYPPWRPGRSSIRQTSEQEQAPGACSCVHAACKSDRIVRHVQCLPHLPLLCAALSEAPVKFLTAFAQVACRGGPAVPAVPRKSS